MKDEVKMKGIVKLNYYGKHNKTKNIIRQRYINVKILGMFNVRSSHVTISSWSIAHVCLKKDT
jgi:hypothetical protein